MIAYVFYSHYDYSDVWSLLFGQSEKFLKSQTKYLITNEVGDFDTKDWNIILYDDALSYQERVYKSLDKVKEEKVIFHHEDMFLLKHPNFAKIQILSNQIDEGRFDFIKLVKASYNHQQHQKIHDNIYLNPSNLSFSIQPTIIEKKVLSDIYRYTKGSNIWSFEKNSNNYVNYLNLKSCYYFESKENKRGLFHWDSDVYPYIATAVVKGKWDYECYSEELTELMHEYKLDPDMRGKNV
jgi:hypothetical protein|tara:strand:- start:2058 stop:2771 length:714 start_codon:yes stop_codon:yes gene_type:complete